MFRVLVTIKYTIIVFYGVNHYFVCVGHIDSNVNNIYTSVYHLTSTQTEREPNNCPVVRFL